MKIRQIFNTIRANKDNIILFSNNIIPVITVVVMVLAVAFQILAYNALRHSIFCICIIILCSIMALLDYKLKKEKDFKTHICWTVLWIASLLFSILNL